MAAATRVVVEHGLNASTASIANEAGVSNGSLFTYFETKTELFNALYIELKKDMAVAALAEFSETDDLREQFFKVWRNWASWVQKYPEKRRAIALLGVSDDITETTRQIGHKTMAPLALLVEKSRAKGVLRDAPQGLVLAIMNSVADATMDYMSSDRENADQHCRMGLEAVWKMIE